MSFNDPKILKKFTLALFIKGLGALSIFVMSFVVAANLAPSESGLFFQLFAVVNVIGMIATLGMQNSLVKYIGRSKENNDWNKINKIYKVGSQASTTVAIIFSVLLFFSSDVLANHLFNNSALGPIFRIGSFSIPLFTIITFNAFSFLGIQKGLASIFLQNISFQIILSIFVLIGANYFQLTGSSVVSYFVVSLIITASIAVTLWFRERKILSDQVEVNLTPFFKSSQLLFVVLLMNLFTQWGSQIVAGIFLPTSDVAYLALAQRVAMLVSFVLLAVNMVAAPKYTVLANENNIRGIEALSKYSVKVMLLIACPISVILLIYAEKIMLMFGEEYISASLPLAILVIGQLINVMTGSVSWILSMTGHEKDLRTVSYIIGPASILLCLILTPLFGVVGSAIAASLAVAMQNLGSAFMIKKRLGFYPFKFF
jgi:O-antigen/teichoic acid export membrane protein